jgi:hypothetical protein
MKSRSGSRKVALLSPLPALVSIIIGEEITLSGTCTDNDKEVFLFLTGPNLGTNGVHLKISGEGEADTDTRGSFETEDVEPDDTWSYKWNTADIK